MKRIESYAELSALIRAQFRPGVSTNAALKAEEYQAELAAGRLYAEAWDEGLYLLVRRDGFWQLYFYLQRGGRLCPIRLEEPVMVEIAFRPRDAALQALSAQWEELGFALRFSRIRMTRAAQALHDASSDAPVWPARSTELAQVQTLLDYFDAVTAWLPTREALEEAVHAGQIYLTDGGALHMQSIAGGSEIRHLVVAPERRGQGVAQRLVRAYLAEHGETISRVWLRTDNAAARAVYEKFGYRADEWCSSVRVCRGKE